MIKIGEGSTIYETAKIVEEHDITIGEDCIVGDFAFVGPRKLVMRYGSQIGPHAVLSGGGEVVLGEFSVVGFGAILISATDTTEGTYMCEAAHPMQRGIVNGSISLGEGAYVSSGAIICVSKKCPDIEIGAFSVIGAGSYIDESVPKDTVVIPKQELVFKSRWGKKD